MPDDQKDLFVEEYKNISILFVDDDAIAQQLLSKFFSGWKMSVASSGEEALKVMEEQTFSIVLIDYQMPGMDGIELLKKIRKRHNLVHTIMVTGSDDVDTLISSIELGACDFVLKPINKETLKTIILRAAEKTTRWKKTLHKLMKK